MLFALYKRKEVFNLDTVVEKIVGEIRVIVCKSIEGSTFFKIYANNEDVLPVRYVIEDTLYLY